MSDDEAMHDEEQMLMEEDGSEEEEYQHDGDEDEEEDDGDDVDEDGVEHDEEEEEDDEEEDGITITSLLGAIFGAGRPSSARYPVLLPHPVPLSNHVQLLPELLSDTAGVNKRRLCDAPSLDAGIDAANKRVNWHGPLLKSQPGPSSLQQSKQHLECLRSLPSSSESPFTTDTVSVAPDSDDVTTPSTRGYNDVAMRSQIFEFDSPAPAQVSRQNSIDIFKPGSPTSSCHSTHKQQTKGRKSGDGQSSKQTKDKQASGSAAVDSRGSIVRRSFRMLTRTFSSGGEGSSKDADVEAGTETVKKSERYEAWDAAPAGPMEQPRQTRVSSVDDIPTSGATQPSSSRLLLKRELGLGDAPHFSKSQQLHMQCRPAALPLQPARVIEEHDNRCYIGQFSQDGSFFVLACQDQSVRVYDVDQGNFKLRKHVRPRGVRWTITETCTSPNQQFLLYASITPTVHLVNISSANTPVESLANITEVHEALEFDSGHDRFGIWSIRWSAHDNQLIGGTNNESVYIFDIGENKVVARAQGHEDDVNAVEYLDDSPNLILSGSDDNIIKLWDRRMLDSNSRNRRSAGVLVGHTEGLTHMNSRRDGRHFISNCKDQTIKLWDIRQGLRSEAQAAGLPAHSTGYRWDYRWMSFPGAGLDVRHPHDASVMTYRGHTVSQTLIRAYFSPAATTGQRFIYSGSAGDNKICIFDVVTGALVKELGYHNSLVRDMSWHPTEPMLVSTSWDGEMVSWAPSRAVADQWSGKPIRPAWPGEHTGAGARRSGMGRRRFD